MRDYQAETLAHVTNLLMERSREVGSFVGIIELALMDFRHDQRRKGIARLQKAVDEYHASQDVALTRLGLKAEPTVVSVVPKPVPTMVAFRSDKDLDYDLKHGE